MKKSIFIILLFSIFSCDISDPEFQLFFKDTIYFEEDFSVVTSADSYFPVGINSFWIYTTGSGIYISEINEIDGIEHFILDKIKETDINNFWYNIGEFTLREDGIYNNEYAGSIFEYFPENTMIMPSSPEVGMTWNGEIDSQVGISTVNYPINVTCTINNMSSIIDINTLHFENCLELYLEYNYNDDFDYFALESYPKKSYYYFAPGVGCIKRNTTYRNGTKYIIELKKANVTDYTP